MLIIFSYLKIAKALKSTVNRVNIEQKIGGKSKKAKFP